jgi:hypothetical protein
LEWWIWLEWARGALSIGGIFKEIGAVLSFRFGRRAVRVSRKLRIYLTIHIR